MTIRTETKTFKIYKFEDLNQEAKEKAIEEHREFQFMNYDQSFLVEDIEENGLKELGFIEPKIYYTGFYSQGDGACFVFDDLDFSIFLKKLKIKSRFNLLFKYNENIHLKGYKENHRYSHENTVSFNSEIDNLEVTYSQQNRVLKAVEKQLLEFDNFFENWRVEKCKEIYKTLEDDFDYILSDEVIKENIIINDYDFNEDGSLY